MIEKTYTFASGDVKLIERIVDDEFASINHVVLGRYDELPDHNANSNVYLIIVRGSISLCLDDQPTREFPSGSIVSIPYRTRMQVSNGNSEVLEFFIVKAPGPGRMHT